MSAEESHAEYGACSHECNGCPTCDPGLRHQVGWRCSSCGWAQLPSPLFGWLREHEHAVKVHREVLCPDRLSRASKERDQ